MKFLNNPIRLMKYGEIVNYPTPTNFVLDYLRAIYNDSPRGYIDVHLFLLDHTPYDGIILRNIANEAIEKLRKEFKGANIFIPDTDIIKVDFLKYSPTSDILRRMLLILVEAINHRVDPADIQLCSDDCFEIVYREFYNFVRSIS